MSEVKYISFFDLPYRPLSDKVASRMITGKGLMFVEHKAKKGHLVVDDKHDNEQLTLVMRGSIRITVEQVSHLLKAGDAVLIPSGVPHTVEVLEDSSVIEVFNPPRSEWMR